MTKYFVGETMLCTVWKNDKFTASKFFSSNQFRVKFFKLSIKTLIWRKSCEKTVAVKFRNFQTLLSYALCGVYEIFVSMFFAKFPVGTTYSLKSFIVRLISRNNSQVIQKFCKLHTVLCELLGLKNFCITVSYRKFRENNLFTKHRPNILHIHTVKLFSFSLLCWTTCLRWMILGLYINVTEIVDLNKS